MPMYKYADPVMDAEAYYGDQEEETAKLPVCSECGDYCRGDKAYLINDVYICESCMSSFAVYLDDYLEDLKNDRNY